jgi:uncharacterized protein (UPF0261 family)
LDTKGEHAGLLKTLIEERGHEAVVLDIGVMGTPPFFPDISRHEIAGAAGVEIRDLVAEGDRGKALAAMSTGAIAVVGKLYGQGSLHGVIGLGGGSGTAIASAAMRALPIGSPKVMVSTMASSGHVAMYVGTRDIVMMNTITDITGMNPILRSVLSNGAAAICGMVEMGSGTGRLRDAGGQPTVAITAFGVTTPAAMGCHELLTEAGFDTMIFHANGTGGRAMEELIEQGVIDAVLDVTTTELPDELCGGRLTAGPRRLEAAGARGIPQVVLPGAIDMVNFGTRETVPSHYADRLLYRHNPNTTLMRTSPEENRALGRWVGQKLSEAKRSAILILPLRGFSEYDREGGVFYDPDADKAFMDAAVEALGDCGEVTWLDEHINSPTCIKTAVDRLVGLVGATTHDV